VNLGRSRGISPIATTAALSVALLIAATGSYIGNQARSSGSIAPAPGATEQVRNTSIEDTNKNGIPDWQDELMRSGMGFSTTSASTTPSDDPAVILGISLINSLASGYSSMKEYNAYSPEQAEKLATTLAMNFKAPDTAATHTLDELTIDPDISTTRILKYRSDMRVALSGLVDLEAEPEFSLFARFIQTNDPKWLAELSSAAERYREAEVNLMKVAVPDTAAYIHLRAANATGTYAQTLERLVRFAKDPLATMALLRTYNDSEREYLLAFDALAKFYAENTSGN
jgi:hypothetical protein